MSMNFFLESTSLFPKYPYSKLLVSTVFFRKRQKGNENASIRWLSGNKKCLIFHRVFCDPSEVDVEHLSLS